MPTARAHPLNNMFKYTVDPGASKPKCIWCDTTLVAISWLYLFLAMPLIKHTDIYAVPVCFILNVMAFDLVDTGFFSCCPGHINKSTNSITFSTWSISRWVLIQSAECYHVLRKTYRLIYSIFPRNQCHRAQSQFGRRCGVGNVRRFRHLLGWRKRPMFANVSTPQRCT